MAKLKSGNAIVRLLLAHGEKLGILAVLTCAGMLVWSAMGLDRLEDQHAPDKLQQLTEAANSNILNSKWDSVDPNSRLEAKPVSADAMGEIAAEHYPTLPDPLNRPILDPISLRTDPPLWTVEDLEVKGDSGLWAVTNRALAEKMMMEELKKESEEREKEEASRKDDREDGREGGLFGEFGRGGPRDDRRRADKNRRRKDGPIIVSSQSRSELQGYEVIKTKSWVTVVGRVPIKNQFDAYDSALETAAGYTPSVDLPEYMGYSVERAEVTSAGTGEWKKLGSINWDLLEDKSLTWRRQGSGAYVSRRFMHPLLTHPLPPLILREWDQRITHSTIPFAEDDILEEPIDEEDESIEEELPEDGDVFAARDRSTLGGRSERFGSRTSRSNPGMGPRMGGFEGGGMYMDMEMGGEGGMGPRGRSGSSRGSGSGMFSWDFETESILFRYFDDDPKLQPGGRYRYRVRLALVDVNHEVPEQYLDRSVLDRRSQIASEKKKVYRLTEWSKRSPIASIPLPARVYLASVEPPKRGALSGEPEISMLVKVFDSELPAELARKVEALRGTVLNPLEKAEVAWTQSSRTDQKEEEKLSEEYLFKTGITVLDARGGDALTKKIQRPSRVLLMDPSGHLFVHSELEDNEVTTEFNDALEGKDTRGRGFGGMGRGGEFGGEFYGEGEF